MGDRCASSRPDCDRRSPRGGRERSTSMKEIDQAYYTLQDFEWVLGICPNDECDDHGGKERAMPARNVLLQEQSGKQECVGFKYKVCGR